MTAMRAGTSWHELLLEHTYTPAAASCQPGSSRLCEWLDTWEAILLGLL
jgi:hypothetical protein